jgi:hypothetical protein
MELQLVGGFGCPFLEDGFNSPDSDRYTSMQIENDGTRITEDHGTQPPVQISWIPVKMVANNKDERFVSCRIEWCTAYMGPQTQAILRCYATAVEEHSPVEFEVTTRHKFNKNTQISFVVNRSGTIQSCENGTCTPSEVSCSFVSLHSHNPRMN